MIRPEGLDLLGRTYTDAKGRLVEVVSVCCLFPTTCVVVQDATGGQWAVLASKVRELTSR